jgi:hypothetical protein
MVETFFSFLISMSPQILVATVGLILVHTRLKRRHPRAYRYGTIGLALLLVHLLLSTLSTTYVRATLAQGQAGPAAVNTFTMTNVAAYVALVASWIFILVALLADRDLAKGSSGAA